MKTIQLSEHFTYKKLIKFTIPTILMMIFTSVYGIVDGIFVSNCVGSDSFAAVNLIMPVLMILGSIGFMIGTGGSALVSKTMGEGEKEKANKYFSMLIYFVVISGFILTIIGIIFIKPISCLLGAEGNILNDCVLYGKTLLIALIAFMLQNCFQSFLVVAEKPQIGLIISICVGLTNMALDFLFIYVFKMGVFGAALATGISQIIGGIIPFIYFISKNNSPLKLVKAKFEGKALVQACINGSSEMLTNLSMSLVNMLYNIQLMKFAGPNGVVAYGIIMYVGFIFTGTYLGYGIGSAPIISYHYGAGNKEELKNLFKSSVILMSVTSFVMTLFAEILSKPLAGIFVSYDRELLDMTIIAIRLFSISYIISGFNIFTSSFFTALNNGVVSATISFLRTLLFQIAMILILPAILGLNGIWLAVVVAEILALVVSGLFLVINRRKYDYV
ncbi:MAG: MATE family efflux transporter [Clostridia bacterium]|nr:MATE family efflux transporter [Clostridia bacterium]